MNQPLTPLDLTELERMLSESGLPKPESSAKSQNRKPWARSLRPLPGRPGRGAAKAALNAFTAESLLTASQIEFVDLIVNHLTEHGAMQPDLLYESPFTDAESYRPVLARCVLVHFLYLNSRSLVHRRRERARPSTMALASAPNQDCESTNRRPQNSTLRKCNAIRDHVNTVRDRNRVGLDLAVFSTEF